MTDKGRFDHDVSRYERPNQRFVCGRAAEWDKPCEFGPSPQGQCGGTTECRPAKVGERYECRRSRLFGGPCAEGPRPDGGCSRQHPPCRPRRSLRHLRGLLAAGAFTAMAAVVGMLFTIDDGGSARESVVDAGPLTGVHANFTTGTGCKACHTAHDKEPGEWMLAAFHQDDMTDRCLDCHTFGGDPRLAHNAAFAHDAPVGQTECVTCHTEHKGETHDIAAMSDGQCDACHRTKIGSFAKDHPAFGSLFPHDRRTAIQFDHNSHFGKHFVDARYAERAPEDCGGCHDVRAAAEAVPPIGFEESCAACHQDNVVGRDLLLLRLPEFEENLVDADEVLEACGPTLEQWEATVDGEALEEEEYEAVSLDEANTIGSYLLGVPSDDLEEYGEPMQSFIMELVESGPEALAERIDERAGDGMSARLLAGLNPELVKRVACAWASNLEYEPPADPDLGGWYGDYLELKYRPVGHRDPVAQAWVLFAAHSAQEEDDDLTDFAELMREEVLDAREGVGACVKCHAISDGDDESLLVEWRYQPSTVRPYSRFSHPTHLTLIDPSGVNLMDPDHGCRTCHKIDEQADYAAAFKQGDPHHFASNFLPISQQTCAQCHNEGQVRQDCQLCHVYHFEPGFDLRMVSHEE